MKKGLQNKDGKSDSKLTHLTTMRIAGRGISPSKKINLGTSMVVQWLGLFVPNAGGLGSIPGQGFHMLLLKTQLSQINKSQGLDLLQVFLNLRNCRNISTIPITLMRVKKPTSILLKTIETELKSFLKQEKSK